MDNPRPPTLVVAPFEVHDVHPSHTGLTGADLVARLQVELHLADDHQIAAAGAILGAEDVTAIQIALFHADAAQLALVSRILGDNARRRAI